MRSIVIHTTDKSPSFLAITSSDREVLQQAKAWLLSRQVYFRNGMSISCPEDYLIEIPFGMAAIGMTAFELAQVLAKELKIMTQLSFFQEKQEIPFQTPSLPEPVFPRAICQRF